MRLVSMVSWNFKTSSITGTSLIFLPSLLIPCPKRSTLGVLSSV
ncbi:hypothetical protein LINGRAPRIM_LOCUS2751 [Linum grandiflorum]